MIKKRKSYGNWVPDGNWRPLILSVLAAVLISVISYLISLPTNIEDRKIANEALEVSKKSLLESQRPWLVVKPVKFEPEESYISITKSENGYITRFLFEITNTGKSTASNIKSSEIFVTNEESFNTDPKLTLRSLTKAKIKPSGPVALPPGDSIILEIESESVVIGERTVTNLIEKNEQNNYEVPLNIEIYYQGNENIPVDWKVAISSRIKSKDIDYDYLLSE